MRYIGVHVSIAGGVYKAIDRAEFLNINAMQIFLKSAKQWKSASYKHSEIKKFKTERSKLPDLKIFAHCGYLINLAAHGKLLSRSMASFLNEIKRADQLGIEYLVLHPGTRDGDGEATAIRRIAEAIDKAYHKRPNTSVKILLETTPGGSNNIGYKFEHLRDIIGLSENKHRIFVCLDTCHIFSAGYPIHDKDGYERIIDEFETVIGLDKLKLIHLNDSRSEYGSKRDKHNHIGMGFLGDETFRRILNDKRLSDIPMIMETPKTMEETISDNILKDLPMVLETTRKFRMVLPDIILKDIPIRLIQSKRIGALLSENMFKNIAKVTGQQISDLKPKSMKDMIEKSKNLRSAVRNALLKESLKMFDKARDSVFEVDTMNLKKVYELIQDK